MISTQANFGLSEYELAKRDFSEVLNIEPKNKAARDQLKSVVMKVKEINDSERKKYSKLTDIINIHCCPFFQDLSYVCFTTSRKSGNILLTY